MGTATATPMRLIPNDRAPEPMRFRFTIRALDRIAPSDRQVWVYDTDADGLAMMVLPTGVRTFWYSKRCEGRFRRKRIGRFPTVTVEQARKMAATYGGLIASGGNPFPEGRRSDGLATLGDLWEDYLERYAKKHKRTWREDERQYNTRLKRFAGRRLEHVTQDDIRAIHERLTKTAPTAANRLLALVSKMYSEAAKRGYKGVNPAKGVDRNREHKHDRYLDAQELPRFIKAIEAEPNRLTADFLRVLLFTGQRCGNVASMRWEEVDLLRRTWTIPPEKYKTGSSVTVPLTDPVMHILERRREADTGGEWVFPARSGAPTRHLGEPRAGFISVCRRASIQVGGATGLRLHDLRRTLRTWATKADVSTSVAETMIGHALAGVLGVYDRPDLDSLRRGFDRTVALMLATTPEEK